MSDTTKEALKWAGGLLAVGLVASIGSLWGSGKSAARIEERVKSLEKYREQQRTRITAVVKEHDSRVRHLEIQAAWDGGYRQGVKDGKRPSSKPIRD